MTRSRLEDLIIGVSVVAAALTGILVLIPLGVQSPGSVDVAALSPDFWPRVIMIGLCLCGTLILAQGLFARDTAEDPHISLEHPVEHTHLPLAISIVRATSAVIGLFLYYYAIDRIGIILSSSLIILGLMLLGGERRWLLLAALSLLLPIALYYFFTLVANVPMPLGMFEALRQSA